MRQMHPYRQSPYPSLASTWRSIRTRAEAPALCVPRLAVAMLALATLAGATAQAQTVVPTRTTLTSASGTGSTSTGTTLTATVETATGGPVTTGSVDFELANGQSLGSALVDSTGTARLPVASLPPADSKSVAGSGQLAMQAMYHSNTDTAAASADASSFSDSQSVMTEVATPAALTTGAAAFTATGAPTTVTVKQGAYGTTLLTVTSVNGFTGSIQFSCSNLPAQVTCAFNPTQQALAANATFTSTLQIETQAASGTASAALTPRHTGLALALIMPGGLLLLGFARRRGAAMRSLQLLAIGLLLTGATLGLSGCNPRYKYLNHGPSVATGTLPGTYTINVAVDGDQGAAVSQVPLPITLVVQ
jgi:hypothetical protein